MPPDLALSSTLISSNYPCLELIFMVPKVFEPLKFDCTSFPFGFEGGLRYLIVFNLVPERCLFFFTF